MQEKHKLEPLELEKEKTIEIEKIKKKQDRDEKQFINFSLRLDAKVERKGFSEKKSFDFIHLISKGFIRRLIYILIMTFGIYFTYLYFSNN